MKYEIKAWDDLIPYDWRLAIVESPLTLAKRIEALKMRLKRKKPKNRDKVKKARKQNHKRNK